MTGLCRRDVLGLLAGGTAALAGCSDLRSVVEPPEPTVEPATLQEISTGEVPAPEPVVVIDAEERLVDTHRERVVDLLRDVPTPFSADDIPNAVIRAELNDAVAASRENRAAAADADRRGERLRRLRDARGNAAFVATAWSAIDEGTTMADVEATADAVRDDLESAERDREYVGGDDVVRAVLAHGAIEARFDDAASRFDRPRRRATSGAIAIGEVAQDVEEARANLDGATVRYDAYTASLDDPRSRRDGFANAVETLRETVDSRQPDLPDDWSGDPNALVDADVEQTPAGWALKELAYSVDEPERRFRGGVNRLASEVLEAHEFLVAARGFETLRDRIEDGDWRVRSADDVRALRTEAVDAIGTAIGTTPGERLTQRGLVVDAAIVAYADQELREDVEHSDDSVPIRDLAWPLGDYLKVAVTAPATPAASETVLAVLDG